MGLAAGERVGRYAVVDELGAGGMGEVYRATDTQLRRDVALKILRDDAGDTPERRKRFEREARAIGALSHPNVVAIHDVGEQDGYAYFVTELLEGESLRDRLRRGPIPRAEVIDIARQIARGLAAIHGHDIVHRDLKPSNLFLCADGVAKIIDFGIARHRTGDDTESQTQSGSVLGTPRYMAPEQVRGRAVDARTDVFAFGLALYEMLAGAPPFEASSDLEAAAAILELDPAPLGDPALDDLIQRCLAKEPDDRCASGAELVAILDALAAGASPPRRLARRRWRRAAIPAVVIAGIAAAGAVLVIRNGSAEKSADAPRDRPTEMHKITDIPAPRSAGAFAVSKDASQIVYWEPGANRTVLQQVDSREAREIARPDAVETLAPLDFFPDGRLMAWAIPRKGGGSLIALDLDTGTSTVLWRTKPGLWALSPDGDAVAYFEGDRLLLRPIDGSEPRHLITKPEGFRGPPPVWSPDGTRLAMLYMEWTERGRDIHLEVTNLDGDVTRLPIGDVYIPMEFDWYTQAPIGVCWLDDEHLLFVVAGAAGNGELWEIGVHASAWDGRPPRRRVSLPEYTWYLRSAAGKVFFHQRREGSHIALVDKRSTADPYAPVLRLTEADGINDNWGWTADGRVLITTDVNGTFDIVSMAPGTASKVVAGGPEQELQPAASGSAILFWRKHDLDDDTCTLYRIDAEGETELFQSPADRLLCPTVGCGRDAPDRCFILEYAASGQKNLRRLDPRTGQRGDVVSSRDFPTFVEMSPDGQMIAAEIPNRANPGIAVIDVDTGVTTNYPTAPLRPGPGIAWNNEPGTWIIGGKMPAAREFDGGVLAIASASGAPRVLRRFDALLAPYDPHLSPDGNTIAVTVPHNESNIWVMEGL